uniref:CHK domain-containing protein n=1 Tax=Strongyloides papillosus TaxID=174720 RepID=A0A0N5BG84_STREA
MDDCFLLNDIKSLKVSDVLRILEESFQRRLYSFKNVHPSISIGCLYCFDNLDNYLLKDVTNGCAFMSNIIRIEFFWKQEIINYLSVSIENSEESIHLEDILLKRVVVKVPRVDQASGHFDDTFQGDERVQMNSGSPESKQYMEMHIEFSTKKEILFYTNFSTNHSNLKIPKFYGYKMWDKINRDGLLIMEDLGRDPSINSDPNKVYGSVLPMVPGFNEQQLLSIIKSLAEIHGTSATIPMDEKIFATENFTVEGYMGWICSLYSLSEIAFVEKLNQKQFKDKIQRSAPFYCEKTLRDVYYGTEKRHGLQGIFVHNDFWAANVLFKKSPSGTFDEVHGIIDWQTLNLGNPMADLARLLAFNTTSKYRRENENRLIEYYHKIFNETVNDECYQVSLENLKLAYYESLPLILIFFAFSTPLYYFMNFIVTGTNEEIKKRREELINRTSDFYDDVLERFNM